MEGIDRRRLDDDIVDFDDFWKRVPTHFDCKNIHIAYKKGLTPRGVIDYALMSTNKLLSGHTELGAPIYGLSRIKIGSVCEYNLMRGIAFGLFVCNIKRCGYHTTP